MKLNLSFLGKALSEPDGSPSSSRILCSIIVFFTLGVGMSLAISAHLHHITMDQFSNWLVSAGQFIGMSCGPLYAVNKGADAFKNKVTSVVTSVAQSMRPDTEPK